MLAVDFIVFINPIQTLAVNDFVPWTPWKCPTHVPMNDNLKSTRSSICSMAGTTRSIKQSLASGHFDIMCASRGTFIEALDFCTVKSAEFDKPWWLEGWL